MKRKVRLQKFEIKSFVTSLSPSDKLTVQGGAAVPYTMGECAFTGPYICSNTTGTSTVSTTGSGDNTWSDIRDTMSLTTKFL